MITAFAGCILLVISVVLLVSALVLVVALVSFFKEVKSWDEEDVSHKSDIYEEFGESDEAN